MGALKGPFQVSDMVEQGQGATRNYDCPNYSTCLSLAGALDWDDFVCQNCNGEVNEALYWQARIAQRSDPLAKKICAVPGAIAYDSGVPSNVDSVEDKIEQDSSDSDKPSDKSLANE